MSDENQSESKGLDFAQAIRAALLPRRGLELDVGDSAEIAGQYRRTLEEYRRHSLDFVEAGDYQQGAEKAWESYAESVKAIAADYGFRLCHHGHIVRAGGALSDLADQQNLEEGKVLRWGLGLARSLHQHFYENDLSAGDVIFSSERVSEAIDLMQQRFSAATSDSG